MPPLIKLAFPEQPPKTPWITLPECTHARVVNVVYEVDRPAEGKPGYFDIWLAKGYLDSRGEFREAPGVPGIHVQIIAAEALAQVDTPSFEEQVAGMLCKTGVVLGALREE